MVEVAAILEGLQLPRVGSLADGPVPEKPSTVGNQLLFCSVHSILLTEIREYYCLLTELARGGSVQAQERRGGTRP